MSELTGKLGQWVAYNQINQDIEQFKESLDEIENMKEKEEQEQETDIYQQIELCQV